MKRQAAHVGHQVLEQQYQALLVTFVSIVGVHHLLNTSPPQPPSRLHKQCHHKQQYAQVITSYGLWSMVYDLWYMVYLTLSVWLQ